MSPRNDEIYQVTPPEELAGTRPYYEFYGDRLVIHDIAWGDCEIGNEVGDTVLLALFHNPAVRRLMAINQLSLAANTETVPGTAPFSRFEHAFGSLALVRSSTENMNLDSRDRLLYQLRTFISDVAHTAYSHIGDFIFQGLGKAENQHDVELPVFLEQTGIKEILESFDIALEEVVGEFEPDFVECDSPSLGVDRVDYGARQIMRWFGDDEMARDVIRPESFEIIDNQFVMQNKKQATWFAKAFLLLPTEHFSEPFHSLQMLLHQEAVRYLIAGEYSAILALYGGDRGSYAPREIMYSVDGDLTATMENFTAFTKNIRSIMIELGASRRDHFDADRMPVLRQYLANDTDEYPDPFATEQLDGPYSSVRVVTPHTTVTISPAADESVIETAEQLPNTLNFFLPILKPRYIDPIYKQPVSEEEIGQGVQYRIDSLTGEYYRLARLSDEDSNFKSLLAGQRAVFHRSYLGQLTVAPAIAASLRSGLEELAVEWPKALARPVMPLDVFKRLLNNSVGVAALYRLIDLRWYD
jgi:hypothetical protein